MNRGKAISLVALGILLAGLLVCGSCVALIMFGILPSWGSPTMELIIENQTDHELTVYVYSVYDSTLYGDDRGIGTVSPGGQITDKVPYDINKYFIKAKTMQGEIVFAETLTRQDMQKIESKVSSIIYKIIIK